MKKKSTKIPEAMEMKASEILVLTDGFCEKTLSTEVAELARALVAALARKRPSPLSSGRSSSWGAGVVHALCHVNFLFDRSKTPHTSAEDVADYFGVSKGTVAGVSKKIRDALKISYFSSEWTLPSRMKDNPFAWMISYNGLMVDARTLPLPLQQIAYQKGLIPFVPGEE